VDAINLVAETVAFGAHMGKSKVKPKPLWGISASDPENRLAMVLN
jgi:hypothetical protein